MFFCYTTDSGNTYQSAYLPSSSIHSVYQTNDTTYLLFGSGGSTHRLVFVDSLIINDTAGTGGAGIEDVVSTIHFFPNPATAEVNLEFMDNRPRSLQLWSTEGKMALEQKVHLKHHRLDIRSLKGGMYVLKVGTDGEVQTLRLLKMD